MEEFKQKLEETLNRLYKENKLSIDAYVELIEFADPNPAYCQTAVEKLNFENETENIKNRSDVKKNIMRFYFKVKNSKLYNPYKLQHQTRLAVKRLIKKHDIRPKSIEFRVGTIDDDFVYNRHRLCISFKFS